ncbi:MAG TPA: carboxylesterase family protein, partial [Polyangiaceae bacterium]|nr:carboxylesterase family protein [Polyangiaceae bacterium]
MTHHAYRFAVALLVVACTGVASEACSSAPEHPGSATPPAGDDGGGGGGTSGTVMAPNVGTINGTATATMRSFKGIPYAQPPIGPLRWKPPQKAAPLTAPLDATKFASGCVQDQNPFGTGSTNEDCLYLNVYAPVGAGPFPVMVWIHGG